MEALHAAVGIHVDLCGQGEEEAGLYRQRQAIGRAVLPRGAEPRRQRRVGVSRRHPAGANPSSSNTGVPNVLSQKANSRVAKSLTFAYRIRFVVGLEALA